MLENDNLKKVLPVIVVALLIIVGFIIFYGLKGNDEVNNNSKELSTFEKAMSNKTDKLPIIIDVDDNQIPYMEMGIDKIELKKNGEVYLHLNNKLSNKYSNPYKVNSEIVDIRFLPFGQGGYRTIVFLTENGTIDVLDSKKITDNNTIEIRKNVGNLTNIIDIADNGYTVYDVNNNDYIISQYFYSNEKWDYIYKLI